MQGENGASEAMKSGTAMKTWQDRTVYLREDGLWVNQLNGSPWTSTLHPTREEALRAAREQLVIAGGGDLTLLAADGTIESEERLFLEACGGRRGELNDQGVSESLS